MDWIHTYYNRIHTIRLHEIIQFGAITPTTSTTTTTTTTTSTTNYYYKQYYYTTTTIPLPQISPLLEIYHNHY